MVWIEENMKTNIAVLLAKGAFSPMGKKGFTLMEILVSVMILAILITMSVPMYERTVEKSRLAEVSTMLKRISESKLRTMDSMNITTFTNGSFGLNMLDVDVPASVPRAAAGTIKERCFCIWGKWLRNIVLRLPPRSAGNIVPAGVNCFVKMLLVIQAAVNPMA